MSSKMNAKRMTRFHCFEIIIFAALVSTFVLATQVGQNKDAASKRSNKWRALLDWNAYMNFFNKRYSSLAQQLVRQKLFMARAMGVFVSGVKYSMYKISYYEAINKFSDLTPEEAKNMLNGDSTETLVADDALLDTEAREALLETLQERGEETDSIEEQLQEERSRVIQRRRKRSTSHNSESRVLSMDDLVRVEDDSKNDDSNIKIERYAPSNNENYEAIETAVTEHVLPKDKTINDIPEDKLLEIERNEEKVNFGPLPFMQSIFSSASSFFKQQPDNEDDENGEERERDDEGNLVMIRDWRESGCISPPISQGDCFSCYAISSMAYVEWALCMSQNSTLTPLSVQYMVDCGRQYRIESEGRIKLGGCKSGSMRHAMDFIEEYGIELGINLPYLEAESQCPIRPFTERKKKGYIRPNLKPVRRLGPKTAQLDLALKAGPVMVSMREPRDILAYGGGMIDGCKEDGGHAMLIIGTGIEDGVEFLLIKNSFGTSWGYDGFFKFKRSAIVECVKEFLVPKLLFPSQKSIRRRMRAYSAGSYGNFRPLATKRGDPDKLKW